MAVPPSGHESQLGVAQHSPSTGSARVSIATIAARAGRPRSSRAYRPSPCPVGPTAATDPPASGPASARQAAMAWCAVRHGSTGGVEEHGLGPGVSRVGTKHQFTRQCSHPLRFTGVDCRGVAVVVSSTRHPAGWNRSPTAGTRDALSSRIEATPPTRSIVPLNGPSRPGSPPVRTGATRRPMGSSTQVTPPATAHRSPRCAAEVHWSPAPRASDPTPLPAAPAPGSPVVPRRTSPRVPP